MGRLCFLPGPRRYRETLCRCWFRGPECPLGDAVRVLRGSLVLLDVLLPQKHRTFRSLVCSSSYLSWNRTTRCSLRLDFWLHTHIIHMYKHIVYSYIVIILCYIMLYSLEFPLWIGHFPRCPTLQDSRDSLLLDVFVRFVDANPPGWTLWEPLLEKPWSISRLQRTSYPCASLFESEIRSSSRQLAHLGHQLQRNSKIM